MQSISFLATGYFQFLMHVANSTLSFVWMETPMFQSVPRRPAPTKKRFVATSGGHPPC